ncbi:histone-lysine N-methyltransferas-like protein [Massariosphaeria phaeospora]|uniref:Histone-lysine N-methyltransferase, H3 lysine-79 specific n=1 Tax=Massariosphaeria phaeospora TaxID=100035 RepID=A0A7C8ICG8_9PLEO|nr:histone-lysine N-methyltransferas-like protein [Massariosphaeria phaeospora]
MFSSKPKIRTRTVTVPVKKPPAAPADQAPSSQRTPSQTTATPPQNGTIRPRKSSGPAAAPTSRYSLTPSHKVRTSSAHTQSRDSGRSSLSVGHIQQRKRKVTPTTPQWASSSDDTSDGDDDEDRLGARKRQKTSSSSEPANSHRCLEPDVKRRIRIQDVDPAKQQNGLSADEKAGKQARLIHGLKMSRGDWVKDFKPAFPDRSENMVVQLQYPSASRPERFETVVPHDNTNFNPLDDIYFNVEEIIEHYLPADLRASLTSETDGPVRLLKRAVAKGSPEDFSAALHDFNTLIAAKMQDGTIPKVLDAMHAIPLSLTKRILAQVYQRTVSPHAHLLRRVKGKETTYGELLPSFAHTIFQQTALTSSSVFVDLGSGVGNVVLQSALQTGAESWGIEIMDTPASFGAQQASELRARAKLWNISLGPITLLHGDFLDAPPLDAVLRRADVVLVNNKVFPQALNGALLDKFLDLKMGAKLVSLESFGLGGKQGVRNEQSIANLFDEEAYESGTYSVSWAGESVKYFIATKAR